MRDHPPLTYEHADGFVRHGRVESVSSEIISVSSPALTPGDIVHLERRDGSVLLAEVRVAEAGSARCTPLGGVTGVVPGASVRCELGRLGSFPLHAWNQLRSIPDNFIITSGRKYRW